MEMTDIATIAKQEACLRSAFSCNPEKSLVAKSAASGDLMLRLDLSGWLNYPLDDLLKQQVDGCQRLSLCLCKIGILEQGLCTLLSEVVGPKLVEISFDGCNELTWKLDVKRLFSKSRSVEVINLKNNRWVDDHVLEQLAIRFQKCLRELRIENCSQITNNALFHIGKRCHLLRVLSLDHCSKINDTGILELAKNTQLQSIRIAHNFQVSDRGLEALISAARNLTTLELCNCPKLSDKAVAAVYEAVVSWGRKRNVESHALTRLVLTENPNFTAHMMVLLSASIPGVTALDLQECHNLDLVKGLSELTTFQNIKNLSIGPSRFPFSSHKMLETLLYHAHRLVVLNLCGLPDLLDDHIAELIENSESLDELILQDMNCGTATVEAICSYTPNISKVSIIGSNAITDMDLRCLTTVCISMKELSIQRCNRLSDSAFTRASSFRVLRKLNVAHCSVNCTGALLKYFTLCPLNTLVIDGLTDSPRVVLRFLSPTTLTKLESISIRSSPGLRLADVHYILENFVRCRSIDLTDSLVGSDQVKADTEHFVSPFLSYLNNGRDFCGFRLTSDGFQQYTQFWETKLQLRKHYAARLLQKLRHRYKESMRKLIERRKEVWSVYKIQQAIKIQSLIRMHLARRRLQPILWAGRRIVRGARDYFFYKDYLKLIKAKRYYKIRLVRKSMTAIMISRQRAMTKFSEFSEIVARRRCYWMLRQYFSTLQRLEVIFRDNIFSNKASVIHELAFLRNIVDHWKLLVYGRETMRQRKQKLITIFLACVDLSTHNSTPQKARTEIAIHFNNRNIIIVRWLELCRDLLEIRRVESLVPIATNFYARTFFERVVGSCFLSISDYRDLRVWKKRNKERGSKHHHFFRLKKAFQSISIRVDSCIQQRNLNRQHFLQRGIFMQRLALQDRFLSRTVAIVGFKNLRSTACLHFNNTISKRGLSIMKVNIVAMKQWRVMNRLAEIHRDKLFSLHSMRGWKCFIKFKKNLGDLYAKLYWNRRCSKILRAIAIVVAEKKGKIEQMNTEMHAKFRNEEHFQEVVEKMRSMQRMILVRNAQARFRELRITKLTAIQTLQNFIRTGLALKEFRRRKRLKLLEEKVREDQELDLMRDADGETRFYNYIIKSIIDIQRFVRGCLGRKIAADRLLEKVRERGAEFYEQNDQLRNRFEQFQRAAQAKENARIKCAVLIQKRARGMIGRRIFRDVKYLAEKNKYAVYVQTAYRRRLARLKLDALQRDKVSDLRFRAARKQRGLMLRLVGLRTRHTQQYVAKLLKFLGIDPVTFNYRVSELVRDTINDFDRLRSIYERERDLYREHGLNRINRAQSRRRTLAAEGWRLVVGDAVRVIEEGHRYAGYTGVIIRIDDSLLGVPLYEVKLDRYANRQTFVRMTTDALTVYTSSQPLAKISAKPFLTEFKQPHKIYGLGKEDLFYCKKNVRAAWTIQRAFRMHRARKIARRKRFEFWSRSKAVQWSLINHLADTNTLTEQGGNVTKLLGLHPKKPVHFNELRHSLLPARFASQVRKLNEKVVISKEIEMKYQDRLKYMQKCTILGSKEYFSTGYQKITLGRKLGMLFNMTAGLKMKQNSSLKDVTGARGVRHLVSQRSMVTGVDRFRFKQLHGSPHVRYYKTQLYQGEWSGLPLFTPLRPHGEGVVIFLDGWGFAKENKVLYLTIVRCRYLNVADLFSSDPYCDIFCNNTNLQTTVKWSNLNPEYHESFEIDVTNPNATLNIIVKDKDYIGSDDFLGQIMLDIKEFEDGKEHHETYQLLGEDIKVKEDFDRGEIELRIRWSERVFEDDQVLIENKKRMAIRLQAWARRISALNYLHVMQKDRTAQLAFMKGNAIKITNTCRIRLARKEYRRRMRELKTAVKIQKRIRIFIAKRVFIQKKVCHFAAIQIQVRVRIILAQNAVRRIKEKAAADLNNHAVAIQKNARRMIVLRRNKRKEDQVEKLHQKARDDISVDTKSLALESIEPVSSWILWYGVDQEYGLRRNRRIVEKLYQRILRTKFVRLVSKYGVVYAESYPPAKDDSLDEMAAKQIEELSNPEEFVSVYFPSFDPVRFHRREAIDLCMKHNHRAILYLSSAVFMRKTVEYNIITIQCMQRQRLARAEYRKMLRVRRAVLMFQKAFRRRYERLHKAAITVTSLFRMISAKRLTKNLTREFRSASTIKGAYRCYRARCKLFDRRCVEKLSVLKYSSAVPMHGADKCLEHRSDTFWIAESNEFAEIRVELSKVENITDIWIMTSTYSASPQFISISAVMNKETGYRELVDKHELPFLKEHRWHHFELQFCNTKYFKISFFENYGDEKHISVRQIRFARSREKSVKITEQPLHYILTDGPTVGDAASVVLKVAAEGWPLPTYQWFRNDQLIEGETKPELKLTLKCSTFGQRAYRCLKCKMLSRSVPFNTYHIKCGNCGFVFVFKEVDEYDKEIVKIKEGEKDFLRERNNLLSSRLQMKSFNDDAKYKDVLQDLDERLDVIEENLQVLREQRFEIKNILETVNKFSDEGIYVCQVQNIRGKNFKIIRKSVRAVVVVEHSQPYVVAVIPMYVPRTQGRRKRWNVYHSLQGTFKNGRIEGIVRIRYIDGSFYEGPYVPEEAIDENGAVNALARAKNHYGMYKLANGKVFEGALVDNHFDPFNLQQSYKLTLPNGEIYEGQFCDENYHGIGMYWYADSSFYEGNWHRGSRFGHGHFRSSEGWTYEGFFDTNRRHRQGIISWPNGSCYMGDWYYDKIQGKGIFITPLRDVYKGEFQDEVFNGKGDMIYADGSRYIGDFRDGMRHGRGIFLEREGNEYYGNFIEDKRHGEHVVKTIIPIEENGQDNYEIKIALFKNGEFVKWKTKFSNPIATRQFIAMFKKKREMFDSVYSMILARNLPNLPDGIDANNDQVKRIIFKIRNEAGMLVGQQAMNQARQEMEALLVPINRKKKEISTIKEQVEAMSLELISLEKDVSFYNRKFSDLLARYDTEIKKIEQFWNDEPTETKFWFQTACKSLDSISVEEYFSFRNHRIIPVFVKKIFDAISYLLNIPDDWATQQLIIADSIANGRAGDQEAICLQYKCKLSFLMQNYYVYDYVNIAREDELQKILIDSRFRRDSYYIESTGPPGPILVDWIRSNYAYIKKARTMHSILLSAEQKKTEGYRYKASLTKKKEEISYLLLKFDKTKKHYQDAENELEDLEHSLLKANDLLQFIIGRFDSGENEAKRDYYKQLEEKIEAKRDFFEVEVCVQNLISSVEHNIDREARIKRKEAELKGEVFKEQNLSQEYIIDWLREEVLTQQEVILNSGRSLGYSFEPEENAVGYDYSSQLISLVIDIVVGKMNDRYNDMAATKQWLSMRGKLISCRFLYIYAWKLWEEEAIAKRDRHAKDAWEAIFITPEECARRAVEARVSMRMSSVAREQAKVWAKSHPKEIQEAELFLARQFEDEYYEDTATYALNISEDTANDEITPTTRASCACWIKLNPESIGKIRDERNFLRSQEFEDFYKDNYPAEMCFKILNGWAQEEDIQWMEYAEHWRSFNMEKYQAAAESITSSMAKDFADTYSVNTHIEAARIQAYDAVSEFIVDEEVKKEYAPRPQDRLNAHAWGIRNQGMLRKGKDILEAEYKAKCTRQWHELIDATDNFTKGSSLFANTTDEDTGGAKGDRFAGFRKRLESKYAWLHGFISQQQLSVLKEIENLKYEDPIEKTFHRIRPSDRDRVLREIEDEFQSKKRSLEQRYESLISQLSVWNTYFGTSTDEVYSY